jgi:sterol desaturase/sphingolipid hydroxylase (fatty acid hydroxylase superfamily)
MVVAFLRHGSNALLAAGAVGLAVAGASGRARLKPAAVAGGTLLFFLSEYGTHRFLFHARPSKNAFVLRLQRRLHYDHHVDPARLDLLFLPPWFLAPALGVFTALYARIAREPATVRSLVLGNLLGLLYYEWVHYVAHVPFAPLTPYGRWIKKYHLWHHFKNEKLWFGVTNPSFDALGGTYVGVAEAERSPTVRSLYG